uniref:Uncharacterized protein n=1 Tax=Opuntia streptacantha TaxID=393608 RepID=A0A7C9A7K2_OPUST
MDKDIWIRSKKRKNSISSSTTNFVLVKLIEDIPVLFSISLVLLSPKGRNSGSGAVDLNLCSWLLLHRFRRIRRHYPYQQTTLKAENRQFRTGIRSERERERGR